MNWNAVVITIITRYDGCELSCKFCYNGCKFSCKFRCIMIFSNFLTEPYGRTKVTIHVQHTHWKLTLGLGRYCLGVGYSQGRWCDALCLRLHFTILSKCVRQALIRWWEQKLRLQCYSWRACTLSEVKGKQWLFWFYPPCKLENFDQKKVQYWQFWLAIP